ncbi:mitogen-activated protein kinase kinase kinase 1 isoform X1 [Sesamum indicum]|uniref:mitogen-activated protein kinase kinase kinase n=2 Tax=Sesamum indicum TaxID=4182 RepID=A0A6I9SZ22_SESIN|nr:mitogen-activated protein kinase kinase kinase 1 isoform X1 [Sesamum indicum]
MHRLPKILFNSSDRRKSRMDPSSSSSSSPQGAKPKRLDRRNAAKNINYEFSPSTSASSSSYSSEESLRTRSLDLYGGKTSFRIDGSDGEFEIICNTLGFSGIDDFAIPLEEYEAMKVRSASAPVEFTQKLEPILYQKSEDDCDDVVKCSGASGSNLVVDVINPEIKGFDNISHVDNKKFEDSPDFGYRETSRVDVLGTGVNELSKRLGDSVSVAQVFLSDKVSGKSSELRGNGIKGVRPPVLVAPSLMALPMADKESSSLNASRGFAQGTDTCVSRFTRGFYLDEDGGRTEESGQNRSEHEEGTRRRVLMREENCVLLDSCSFTTSSNDDDSSSTTTEPTSSISPNGKYRHIIEDWQKGDLLGRGSFGSVYEGIADDGFFFAVKEVSLLDQGDEGKQRIVQLEQEIALLSQFQHENIVRYYGTNKDESHLYIFLELVTKGSLLSLYQKYELRVPQVSAYTRQILHGLKYLHDRGVIHRDIKCANILVHTNGLVKLADFGLAKATKLNDVHACKGTAFWMAPEVVRSQWYGPAADIWSLGCTVLEMLTRRFPYSHLECMAALYRIGKGERPLIPDSLSSDARDFVLKCLQVDPSLRPTAAQLMDHPFLKRPLPSSSGTMSPHFLGRQL